MNADQVLKWIKTPGSTGKEESAQLHTLLEAFPFYQTAHLLYIKNLHSQGSFLYNTQLKTAAVYAVNRKVLYDLIKQKTVLTEVQPVQKEEILSSSEQETPASVEPPVTVPEFPKKRFVSNPDDWEAGMLRQLQLLHHWKTHPVQTEETKEETDSQTASNEVQPVLSEPSIEVETPEITSPEAEKEINTLLYVLVEPGTSEDVRDAISGQDEITSVTTEEVSEVPPSTDWEVTPINPVDKTDEPIVTVPEDPVQQEIILEAIHSAFELEADDRLPSPDELQPTISTKSEEIIPETTEELSETHNEPEVHPEEESFASWLKKLGSEIPAETHTSTTKSEEDLVERFIREEPRIQVRKSEFYSPVNMAKKSVQESDDFITETLARIYAKQGNIPKAIRAYTKLSLKFPEKSSYFASLIEELKRTPNKPSQK